MLIAGSLSHFKPASDGPGPSIDEMGAAYAELGTLLRDAGCDFIMLEMMYYPERLPAIFAAARGTGLPVWAGFSARRADDGRILSYATDLDIPFEDLLPVLDDFEVDVAGIMHTPSPVVGDALAMLRDTYAGPLMAYPDSGYFRMPEWQFVDVIQPGDLCRYAGGWLASGVQIIGGCCGLSPAHIEALASLRQQD
ncbi:MAG: homocysteine S-methyltransferase family protein [Woeseiaceae bacterium]|nr:homocysteine S-methyltransferase family protein [Woeseiaceae bacterium]